MSAGGSADGAAAGAVDSMHLLILGVVGGLLCIYLSGIFKVVAKARPANAEITPTERDI